MELVFVLSFVSFAALFGDAEAVVKLPPNISIPAVIVFGDSIVDTGNNNGLFSISKCNFLPYGQNFEGGKPSGRFSNGKVPSDLIAGELGVRDTVPAYLDPQLQPKDLLTGVCFASGGTGYDPLTPDLAAVIPLSRQLDYFKEYINRLKALVGEEKTNFILNNGLYLLVSSSNDIANTYFTFKARKDQYDVPSYTTFLAAQASSFLKEIYDLGARRVAVFSAPPLGCVPAQRTLAGGPERGCAENQNQAAQMFNVKLSAALDSLNANLTNSRIVYIDVYSPLLDIIQNPSKYELQVADKGCCGSGELEIGLLCNKITSRVCEDPYSYVFWDSYHPTEATYRALVSGLLTKYVDKFF